MKEIIGPNESCPDPTQISSDNPACAGTVPSGGAGGDGGGSGGGGSFPTLPPLNPPPDVTIVLPPALAEAPTLQLTNSSSTSFKFTTSPVSSSINADVSLRVDTDASDTDAGESDAAPHT